MKLNFTFGLSKSQPFRIKPYLPGVKIAFMHIPKTCGVAVSRALCDSLAPSKSLVHIMDGVLFGSFRDYESLSAETRARIHLDPASLPRDIDFISGHVSFSALRQAYQNGQYITFLREPVSRILSHWLFWRSQSDAQLEPWGTWAEFVKNSREPLSNFISCREVACQLDNLYVRMLLWPHPLIKDNDFIDEQNDSVLLRQAMAELKRFAYVDIVENPRLIDNVESWLGQPFRYGRVNETTRTPEPLRTVLHRELNSGVLQLLEQCTRLDLQLWSAIAQARLTGSSVESIRMRTILQNVTRHSWLVAPGPVSV